MTANVFDSIVVGGGFGGCRAAVGLAAQGERVCLIEAGPRLGGRAGSFFDSHSNQEVDFGQHVFIGAYHETWKLLQTVGTYDKIHATEALDLSFMDLQSFQVSHLRPRRLPPPLHLATALAGYTQLSMKDRLTMLWHCRKLMGRPLPPSYDAVSAFHWLTEELKQNHRMLRDFWEPVCLAALNCPLSSASSFLLSQVLAEGFLMGAEAGGIAYSRVPLIQLLEPSVESFLTNHDSVLLRRHRVKKLDPQLSRVVWLEDGRRLEARHQVVLAVPAASLQDLLPEVGTGFVPDSIANLHVWMPPKWEWPFQDTVQLGILGGCSQWVFHPASIPNSHAPENYFVVTVSSTNEVARGESQEHLKARILMELEQCHVRLSSPVRTLLLHDKKATFSSRIGELDKRRRALAHLQAQGWAVASDWACLELPSTIEGACRAGASVLAGKRVAPYSETDGSISL